MEKIFRVKFFPSVPPSVRQGHTKIPKCPHRATTRGEKVFGKIPKKYFSDILFLEKIFRVKFFPSVPPSVRQGHTKIPKCPHRATTRGEKVFGKIPKKYFSDILFLEKIFRVKFCPSVPPSVRQGHTKIPKCPYRATTRGEKVFGKIPKKYFSDINFLENFSRKNFSPQYPLASARGTQRSLNAPIGPQHEEKKFSEKFRKNTFRIYYFWRKFFA